MHVPGADDDADTVLLQPVRHRRVALLAVVEAVQLERARRHPGRTGAVESTNPVAVRRDGDDGELGVEQRLQVRALAADQHADHASTILPIASSSAASAAGTTAQ